MTLTITDTTMTSDQTPHTARPAPGHQHAWEVSWLPGRLMDRNTAITAMTLADTAADTDLHPRHRLWPHIQGWAAELGLTGPRRDHPRIRPARKAPLAGNQPPASPTARPRAMSTRHRTHHARDPGPPDPGTRIPAIPRATATAGTGQPGPDPAAERLAYSVDEAARLTGLSRDLLYDQMRHGQPGLHQSRQAPAHHPPAPPAIPRDRLLMSTPLTHPRSPARSPPGPPAGRPVPSLHRLPGKRPVSQPMAATSAGRRLPAA